MTTFERIQDLAKKRDKTLKDISLELGYSKNYLYTLKTKEPAADKLMSIADYFRVSIDYLLGRTDNEQAIVSSDHKTKMDDLDEMLDNAMSYEGKKLTEIDRAAIRAYIEGRLDSK